MILRISIAILTGTLSGSVAFFFPCVFHKEKYVSLRCINNPSPVIPVVDENHQFYRLLSGFSKASDLLESCEEYYTSDMDISVSKKYFTNPSIIWNAFLKDLKADESSDELLENMFESAYQYLDSEKNM